MLIKNTRSLTKQYLLLFAVGSQHADDLEDLIKIDKSRHEFPLEFFGGGFRSF